ncbi:hypothetical protein BJ912DRAFT_1018517 [Pholiota molesta]|nr:hypothetical protein BJ912DRAFT_1018517 [Pholiota molesta]
MSVLSPAHSARSFLSPKASGYSTSDQALKTPVISSAVSATYAKSLASTKLPHEGSNLSPDELFTKYTVSEVRAVQHRLRADADAKQEELRLMVGERYRDLLQASSSIISIAKSAQHVLDALEESREAILSQHDLPAPPKTAAIAGLDDRHLVTLQVLSAHMKLLLDAPEHLWRLIERKKYFEAAWLFLLSPCLLHSILQAEFPLVQRQWDVVSQFRPQIIHKSTLSLRESSASSEETCATLVTLHLLDSRPLNETLATLLSQRSKTLQSILAWNSTKPVPVREVTQTMKRALSAIAQTVITARTVFNDEHAKASLIVGFFDQCKKTNDLYLTTQSLLTHLTSSANFQLLPANLRSSSDQWRHSAAQWFLGLQSIKEVWTLRNSIRRYVTIQAFLIRKNILGIWQNLLSNTGKKFKKSLQDNISLSQETEGIKGKQST